MESRTQPVGVPVAPVKVIILNPIQLLIIVAHAAEPEYIPPQIHARYVMGKSILLSIIRIL